MKPAAPRKQLLYIRLQAGGWEDADAISGVNQMMNRENAKHLLCTHPAQGGHPSSHRTGLQDTLMLKGEG